MTNLKDFITIRNTISSELGITILIISLHNYIHTIYNNFGFYPNKIRDLTLIDIPDDSIKIKEQLNNVLDPIKDDINKSGIIGWAERDNINISKMYYKKYTCSSLERIEEEAFIAPDGTWYACCLDSNNELVLGNVIHTSINEIFFSEKRKKLISSLKNKEFAKIGGPCKTVNCCQWLPEKPKMSLRSLIRNLYFKISKILHLKK